MTRDYTQFFDYQTVDAATQQQVRSDFIHALQVDLKKLHVPEDQIDFNCQKLWANMTEESRHYHTAVHVLAMIQWAEHVGLKLKQADRLAVWFHDAIYDTHDYTGGNEAASAQFLRDHMRDAAIDQAVVETAANSIEWTAKHTEGNAPADCQRVLDLDLAGMSAEQDSFDLQSKAVREEFGHVPLAAYVLATVTLFEKILARPKIYYSKEFARLEAKARRQLSNEIDKLRSLV